MLSLLAMVFVGCHTAEKTQAAASNGRKIYSVSADSAPFFRHGPQQGRNPDLALTKDTLVRLIRPSFGFSKVQLMASGEEGYVASDDIRPASPNAIAAAEAPPTNSVVATSSPAQPDRETLKIDSSDPRLIAPPEQLPAPDLPQPRQ